MAPRRAPRCLKKSVPLATKTTMEWDFFLSPDKKKTCYTFAPQAKLHMQGCCLLSWWDTSAILRQPMRFSGSHWKGCLLKTPHPIPLCADQFDLIIVHQNLVQSCPLLLLPSALLWDWSSSPLLVTGGGCLIPYISRTRWRNVWLCQA